jgi:hypothetical protein
MLACAGAEPGVVPSDTATVGTCLIGIMVSPASAMLHPGDAFLLSATGGCANQPVVVRCMSSDTLKATVDSVTGLVRAKSVSGSVSIIASLLSDRTVQGAAAVQVEP